MICLQVTERAHVSVAQQHSDANDYCPRPKAATNGKDLERHGSVDWKVGAAKEEKGRGHNDCDGVDDDEGSCDGREGLLLCGVTDLRGRTIAGPRSHERKGSGRTKNLAALPMNLSQFGFTTKIDMGQREKGKALSMQGF
jgi:hypothetical protein